MLTLVLFDVHHVAAPAIASFVSQAEDATKGTIVAIYDMRHRTLGIAYNDVWEDEIAELSFILYDRDAQIIATEDLNANECAEVLATAYANN